MNRRLTPEKINVAAGLTATYLSDILTPDTHQIANDGKVWLHAKKSGAGNAILTFVTPKTVGGLAVADPAITVVATTGDKFIGPFLPNLFNNKSGDLEFTIDDVVGFTLAILRFP